MHERLYDRASLTVPISVVARLEQSAGPFLHYPPELLIQWVTWQEALDEVVARTVRFCAE